jgi:hypothetical protein
MFKNKIIFYFITFGAEKKVGGTIFPPLVLLLLDVGPGIRDP